MKTKQSSDNTNHKHVESKHADSLLSSIIESPDNMVIFALDRDYGYTAFNTNHKLTIKKIWDADIEIGMNMLEIIKAPEDKKKAKHNFDRVLNGERFTLIEEYGEPPNRFYYENIYNPIFDDTHKVTGLSVFLTDITEKKKTEDELNKYRNQLEDLVVQRTQELVAAKNKLEQDITDLKQAEETLAKSEQRYRSLYEDSLAATYTSTLGGNILDCNENFVHILGYKSSDEIIGKKSQDLYFSSNDRKQFLSDLTEHNQLITYESRMKRKDGQEVWIMENVSLLDQDTIQGTMFDITEHRKTVVALGESEERFRSLFENATIGLYRTTPDGQILLANPALVHMLGYSTYEELCNRNLDKEGFEGRYSRGEFIDRIEQEGQISGLESTWKKSDGTWIHIRESVKASRDEEGSIRYYEGTVEDITERKQTEEALWESEKKFKEIATSIPGVVYQFTVKSDGSYAFPYIDDSCDKFFHHKAKAVEADPNLIFNMIPPNELQSFIDSIGESARTLKEWRHDFRVVLPDGQERCFEGRSIPRLLPSGEPFW
ncbi:MAG: PAS domain S-box protein, partial [Candidatus Marinimicrobia bacterium]|nr:PAS domain S-box protein [Candidatus Neomarinimicrobiota bacterium]